MAHHGESLHRHRDLLRRRESHGADSGSRSRRAEERLRLRRAVSRTVQYAAAARAGQKFRAYGSGCRGDRYLLRVLMRKRFLRLRRAASALVLSAALAMVTSTVSTNAPRFYPDDPIAREVES